MTLASEDIQFIEKSAPKAIQELRTRFYKKRLSSEQIDVLTHPEWANFSQGKGNFFKEDSKLAIEIKELILKNLHDKEKVIRLMDPLTSLLNQMTSEDIQKKKFERVAPKLYQVVKNHISSLNLKYNRNYGMDNDYERER